MITKESGVRYASVVIASVAILVVPVLSNLMASAAGPLPSARGFLFRQWSAHPPVLHRVSNALRFCDQFWNAAGEAARSRCCNDLPLLIISQDPVNPRNSQPALIRPIWNFLQERLKALSPRGHRIIARGSGRAVMNDRPDVLVRGVRQINVAALGRHKNSELATSVE